MEKSKQQRAWDALIARMREIVNAPTESQSSLARRLGRNRSVIHKMLSGGIKGERISIDKMRYYFEKLGMDMNPYIGEEQSKPGIPLIGLAACGHEWCTTMRLAISAAPVPAAYSPEMFAVAAIGTSMQPCGIYEGFILYCDPSRGVEIDDLVYVEREDKTVSIKLYKGLENQIWHKFVSWLPPDENNRQEMQTVSMHKSNVIRIVPVIFIQRKP